jgi:hypothetical protein
MANLLYRVSISPAVPGSTSAKGTALTNAEIDGNFKSIDNALTSTNSAVAAVIPTQTGNSGKYLTTNGTIVSWSSVDALPLQTSNAGKYLTTNGTVASWVSINPGASGGGTDSIFFQNDQVVTTDYSITAGKNAGTFGPVTINNGVIVTVPVNSVWTIV